MELDALKRYLLEKEASSEEVPFGPEALVYKVAGKMFALVAWQESPMRISLKCDPWHAAVLRERYPGVRGAYHMNKTHWNMVDLDCSVPLTEVFEMIDDSYRLVVNGLPKSQREKLASAG